MLARLHTIDATPEQYEAGLRIVKEDLLPWARESSGYCGAIGLVDRDSGKALLLTLWADDEARASAEYGRWCGYPRRNRKTHGERTGNWGGWGTSAPRTSIGFVRCWC